MKDKIGPKGADLLLEALPPMDTSQIATKTDVDNVRIELRGEMSELRGEFAELRGEMATGFAEIVTVIGDLRNEMVAGFADARSDRADIRGEMTDIRSELTDMRSDTSSLRAELKYSVRNTIITIIAAALTVWLTFYVPEVMG